MIASAKDVEQARTLLGQYLRPTRLVSAESLAGRSGVRVYLKIESDLPTGSFKLRGALNALFTSAAQRMLPGVVAASTGNHGAAVAYAARIAKIGATIFLPENPNPVKRARIVALGAKWWSGARWVKLLPAKEPQNSRARTAIIFSMMPAIRSFPQARPRSVVKSWTRYLHPTSSLSQWVIPR